MKEKNGSKNKPKRLGPFLQEARVRANLLQKDVATALGYQSAQFVSDWERGLRTPPANAIKKLAEMYGVSIEELFDVLLEERIAQVTRELKDDLFGTGTKS